MANIKSAEKRTRVSEKKRVRNVRIKSALKTAVRSFHKTLADDPANGKVALARVVREFDKAAAKGIVHKNAAARRKSRLTKKLQAMV